jgi:hypothetical protein
MCLVSNHAARFIQLQMCASRQQKRVLPVRVLRAEGQLHVQVKGQVQVQVHTNVQGSAWQQQCARAMCSGEQAVARSDPFVPRRIVYLGTRLGTSQRIVNRRACDHQLMGLPRAVVRKIVVYLMAVGTDSPVVYAISTRVVNSRSSTCRCSDEYQEHLASFGPAEVAGCCQSSNVAHSQQRWCDQ